MKLPWSVGFAALTLSKLFLGQAETHFLHHPLSILYEVF
jgi:hypothetical protein